MKNKLRATSYSREKDQETNSGTVAAMSIAPELLEARTLQPPTLSDTVRGPLGGQITHRPDFASMKRKQRRGSVHISADWMAKRGSRPGSSKKNSVHPDTGIRKILFGGSVQGHKGDVAKLVGREKGHQSEPFFRTQVIPELSLK